LFEEALSLSALSLAEADFGDFVVAEAKRGRDEALGRLNASGRGKSRVIAHAKGNIAS